MFFAKAALWTVRLAQWTLAVVLLGISGYFVNEFAQAKSRVPPEVWLPCITSAFAICITCYSITLLYCLGRLLLNIAAFFDFCFMVTYTVAVVLNRFNFRQDGTQNELWRKVTWVRTQARIDPHAARNARLVKAMTGLTTTMMVLFVLTTLMCLNLARKAEEKHEEKTSHRKRSHRRSHV